MNRLLVFRVTAMLAVSLAAAGAAADEATKAEMAKLQGEWSMVSGEIEGQAMPEAMRATAKRVAKDNETTVMIGGQLFMKAQFTVDPSKKPKTIDYTMTGGFTAGKKQLAAVLEKMLAKSPALRYQDPTALLRALIDAPAVAKVAVKRATVGNGSPALKARTATAANCTCRAGNWRDTAWSVSTCWIQVPEFVVKNASTTGVRETSRQMFSARGS